MTASAEIRAKSEDVAALTEGAFARFPPHRRNIWIPLGPPKASAMALTMYTASKPLPLTKLWGIWAATRIAGPRTLPGGRDRWVPPMSPDLLAELCEQWRGAVQGRIDGFALYERIQHNRHGFVVMVCAGKRSMLVRVRPHASGDCEQAVNECAASMSPRSFRVPHLRGSGRVQHWRWLGYEVIGSRPHGPVRRIDRALTDEVTALVEAALPRPAEVPSHWRGCHGDLTPWNLRQCGRSKWLIDWEDARWAPPGADAVYFAAVRSALRRRFPAQLVLPEALEEARRYWAGIIAERSRHDQSDPRLTERMNAALGG
jgi:hypothetical protein